MSSPNRAGRATPPAPRRGDSRHMSETRTGRLTGTLGAVVLIVAVLQTSIVPVLGAVARQLHVSSVAAGWAVTANLLAAAAATPLIGRLADVYTRKRVLLGALGLVVVGSLVAAVTASLPWLIVGRILQGMSFALFPVAVSILRDELPAQRLVRSISVLSAMLGFGGALGVVITGLLMSPGAGYQRVFWLNALVGVGVTIAAAAVVPNRARRADARVDWVGAVILAAGLCAVMLAITQTSTWGWTSMRTVTVAAAGIAILTLWWIRNGRTAHPLVSTQILRHRPVLLANMATFLVGMGLYLSFLGITDFVERGQDGFGASILTASVQFLMPGALAAALTSVVSGRCIERFGARAVVTVGGLAGVAGFLLLTGWHAARWEVALAGLLTNAYISLAYGALPALIVAEIDPGQTAVATSLNGIFRKVGGAAAAAFVAAVLTPTGAGYLPENGFRAVFLLGAITAAGAVLLVGMSGVRLRRDMRVREPLSRGHRRLPGFPGPRGLRPTDSVAAQAV